MTALIQRVIAHLAQVGVLPADTEESRLQKALLTFIATLIGLVALFWGSVYWSLGSRLAGAILLSYAALSGISLALLAATKRFRSFQVGHLLLILILPAVVQWALGGYDRASTVIVWSLLGPLGAMMLFGTRQAIPWFGAFLGLVAFSGLLDPWMRRSVAPLSSMTVHVFYVLNLGLVSTIVFLLLQYFVRERDQAKHRSEQLLLNVLPAAIAERLKTRPDTIADAFEDVSVLFADIVDFTKLSSRSTPQELVRLLNEVFTSFDHLAERHGLEKIKTIGDAYMVVGGLPTPRDGHTEAVAEMALAMLEELKRHRAPHGAPLEIRIGLHVGPAVAGVIGRKKFIYDLWGDTVNTASRMESHGVSGVIQVTEDARRRLDHRYAFEKRGTVEVKGKGALTTYFLTGRLADRPL